MEFNEERLIEAGLNFIAYVAAAGAIGLVYSMFLGKKRKLSAENTSPVVLHPALPSDSSRLGSKFKVNMSSDHRLSGLNPSEIKSEANSGRQMQRANSVGSTDSVQSRFSRNRREVIELARKMLESGEPASRVSDLLPLSESELNLATIGARGNAT